MRRDQDDEDLSEDEIQEMREAFDLDKPDIITKPGRYRMRNGMLAQISKTSGAFPYTCIGVRENPAGGSASGIWASSGRYAATPMHDYDIVEKA
jgi:hypothetical protein